MGVLLSGRLSQSELNITPDGFGTRISSVCARFWVYCAYWYHHIPLCLLQKTRNSRHTKDGVYVFLNVGFNLI